MSRSPGTKKTFLALLAACVRFVFGKTSLASSLITFFDNVQIICLLLVIDVHRCEFCGGKD